jgi:DNA repair ATPase RecN
LAKFFIGTLLDETVVSVDPAPQEHVHYEEDRPAPTLFRMDFVAVIRTEKGDERRILVEMQKAGHASDVPRFRRYLGKNYANDKRSLPITTIYILDFKLEDIETACLRVGREYYDLVNQQPILKKHHFVEQLTHDSYVVQTPRIEPRYKTLLDQLLLVFEQANFVKSEDETLRDFDYDLDSLHPDVRAMLDKLHYVATDADQRKLLDEEIYYREFLEDNFGELDRKITSARKELEKKDKEIEETKAELEQSKAAVAAQAAEIEALKKQFAALKKR